MSRNYYYPQAFLEECKEVAKGKNINIYTNDQLETFSDESDEEASHDSEAKFSEKDKK